jgi:hypothetical protein
VKNVENVLNIMFANQKSVMEHLLPPVKVIQESLNRGKEMTEMNDKPLTEQDFDTAPDPHYFASATKRTLKEKVLSAKRLLKEKIESYHCLTGPTMMLKAWILADIDACFQIDNKEGD